MSLYTKEYSDNVGSTTGYAGFRNRRRLKVLSQLIPVTSSDKILEIGPNTCILLDALKKKCNCIIGIDVNAETVSRIGREDLICMDATKMGFNDNSFDIIIGIEVFEHIPDLKKTFSEIARVLVNGGKCYMTVPFEIFRGQQALGDAWFTYKNLLMARKLHVHKLNPRNVKNMIVNTTLNMVFSKLIWIPGPSFFIVLENKK